MASKKGDSPQVFTVRLDDKMRHGLKVFGPYLGYRTAAKFVTNAVEKQFEEKTIPIMMHGVEGEIEAETSAASALDEIWNPDEAIRFANTGFKYQQFLSDEEKEVWNLLEELDVFWLNGEWKERADGSKYWAAERTPANLDKKLLRQQWENLKKAAQGKISRSELEKRIRKSTEIPEWSFKP